MLDDKDKDNTKSGGKNEDYEKGYLAGLAKSQTDKFEKVAKDATDVGATIETLQEATLKFNKTLGGSADSAALLNVNFTDAAQKILLLDGSIEKLEEGIRVASEKTLEIQKQTNRQYVATAEELKGIVAAQQASGVESATLVKNFKESGYALSQIPKTMQKVIDTSKALGVNVEATSSAVVANIGKLNTFNFANGVEGLTRMAAQAGIIGVDMNRIFSIAEDLFDPEKAVNLASSLQRLGVATGDLLDPLKLMDLGQNNPQELQNQIVEMSKRFTFFNEQNQKFEILPGAKRELREIASAMGMSADELAKMALNSSDLAKKMSEIRFPDLGFEIPEDQKNLIANMAEMRDGQYKIQIQETITDEKTGEQVKTGRVVEKAVSELTADDYKSIQNQQIQQAKSLEEIALESMGIERRQLALLEQIASAGRGSLATSRLANKGGEVMNKVMNDLVGILKEQATTTGGREFLDKGVSQMRDLFGGYTKALTDGTLTDKEKDELMQSGKALDKLMKETMGKGGDLFVKLMDYASTAPQEVLKHLDAATKSLETMGENVKNDTKTSSYNNPDKRVDAQILEPQKQTETTSTTPTVQPITNNTDNSKTDNSVTNTSNLVSNDNRTTTTNTSNSTNNIANYDQVFNQLTQQLPTAFANVKLPDVNVDLNPMTSLQEKSLLTSENSLAELKSLNTNTSSQNQTLIASLSRLPTPTTMASNTTITNSNPTDNSITNNSNVTNNDNKQLITNNNQNPPNTNPPAPTENMDMAIQTLMESKNNSDKTLITGLSELMPKNLENEKVTPSVSDENMNVNSPLMPSTVAQNPFLPPQNPQMAPTPTIQIPEMPVASNITTNNVTERIVESPMNNVGGTIEYKGELTLTVNVNAPDGMNKTQLEESFRKMMEQKGIAQKIEENVIGGRVGSYNPTVSNFAG